MSRTTISVVLTAIVAFAAGYAMRDSVGFEGRSSGEAAVATKIAVRDSGTGPDGPGAQDRAGSSSRQPQDARAFRKGGAEAWLESLKDIDSDDTVTVIQLCQQCWKMDEAETAELLEKCGEILALQNSEDSEGAKNFPDSDMLTGLAGQAAMRLATLSPAKALAMIKSSEDLLAVDELMSCTFGAIAGVDPGLAIAEAQGLEDRSAAVEGIMSPLLAANDLARAGLLLELCPEDLDLKRRFLERALKSDPELAVRKGCEFVASGDEHSLGLLLGDPATRDKAVEWASTWQGTGAERLRGEMLERLAGEEPTQAAEVYLRVASGMSEVRRGEAAAKIAVLMSNSGKDWETWVGSLDDKARQAALVAVIGADDNLRGMQSFPADSPLGSTPRRAEELFNQMPASPEKSAQLEVLARSLMESQPDKARLWLDQMPEGEAKAKLQREIELQAELKILRPPEESTPDRFPVLK